MRYRFLAVCLLLWLLVSSVGYGRAGLTGLAPQAPALRGALAPDGTLRPGTQGSFAAEGYELCLAPDGRPAFRPRQVAGPGDQYWGREFSMRGITGVNVVLCAGTDVYIGGNFKVVLALPARGIARWNGSTWSSLGAGPANGVTGTVTALAADAGGGLYVGGSFTAAGGVPATNVAYWNGSAWRALGTGLNGSVSKLVTSGPTLYASGTFTTAGGSPAARVASWNGTGWQALGAGLNNIARTMTTDAQGNLYVGGNFTQAGGLPANYVARWNGTAWSALGAGVNSTVLALATDASGGVYVGGEFTTAGGSPANQLARWSNGAWTTVGAGPGNGATTSRVLELAVAATGELFVAGFFAGGSAPPTANLARWDGTAWQLLNPANYPAVSLLTASPTGVVYALGPQPRPGSGYATALSRWNGTGWTVLGMGTGQSPDDWGLVVTADGRNNVYVAGSFLNIGDIAARGAAHWDGTAWHDLSATTTANFQCLTLDRQGTLYAAGSLGTVAGGYTTGVFRWTGSSWLQLGDQIQAAEPTTPLLAALTFDGQGRLFVGGGFTRIGTVAMPHIAQWTGTAWVPVGAGLSNSSLTPAHVSSLVARGDTVYAGGIFNLAGGLPARSVARWTGTAWQPLGAGLGSVVKALALDHRGRLYAGGSFFAVSGQTGDKVARWNGSTWQALGTGIDNVGNMTQFAILTMAVDSRDNLYVGGGLTSAGGISTRGIAHWDGAAWTTLGSGLNGDVSGIAVSGTDQVYAAGYFTALGDESIVSTYLARYDAAALATAVAPMTAAPAAPLRVVPNPAHRTALVLLPARPVQAGPAATLTLLDALGRPVRTETLRLAASATSHPLDLAGLAPGLYLVRLVAGDTIATQRLVVE